MKKVFLGVILTCAALASDDPKDYDDRVTIAGLDGSWRGVSGEDNGQAIPPAQLQNAKLVFKGEHGTLLEGGKEMNLTVRTDPNRHPAHLDLTMLDGPGKSETMRMIYSIEGDNLKLALYTQDHGKRPTEFKSGPGSNVRILVLRREGK
jgi:uncharacterized protein (TIGR03067 family)